MRGMLPHSEARMRMCVMKMGQRGRWTSRDWVRWRFLWKFFPWYAREMRYRGDFCVGQGCMHWFWEDANKKERGYCSAAVSRTQHMMWAEEWQGHDRHDPQARSPHPEKRSLLAETRSLGGSEQRARREQAARARWPFGYAARPQDSPLKPVTGIAVISIVILAVVISLM